MYWWFGISPQKGIFTARPKERYRKHFYRPAIKRYFLHLLALMFLFLLFYILLYCFICDIRSNQSTKLKRKKGKIQVISRNSATILFFKSKMELCIFIRNISITFSYIVDEYHSNTLFSYMNLFDTHYIHITLKNTSIIVLSAEQ